MQDEVNRYFFRFKIFGHKILLSGKKRLLHTSSETSQSDYFYFMHLFAIIQNFYRVFLCAHTEQHKMQQKILGVYTQEMKRKITDPPSRHAYIL